MAGAAVEGAELLAPEAEVIGEKVAAEAEEVGSELFNRFARKGARAAEAAPAGRDSISRLMDVGTGVLLGQSLQGPSDQKAAQAAAVQQPLGAAALAAGAGEGRRLAAGSRSRDGKGRFVAGGDGSADDVTLYNGGSQRRRVTGGQGGGTTLTVYSRLLAEQMQIAVLVVLFLLVATVSAIVAVKKPGPRVSLWTGAALGAVTGATLCWVFDRPKAA